MTTLIEQLRNWLISPATKPEPTTDLPAAPPAVPYGEPLSSTCESLIELSDPRTAYNFGFSSGQLWAIANPADPPSGDSSPWTQFVRYRAKSRLTPSEDTVRQMAGALTLNPEITDEQARDYLSAYSPGFPVGLSATQFFLDGLYWGILAVKKEQREQRRKVAEAKRADDLQHFRRFGRLN